MLKGSDNDPAVWIIELRRRMGFTNRIVKRDCKNLLALRLSSLPCGGVPAFFPFLSPSC